ncbi:MAG: hypothetical protein KGL67_00240 [Patescibacteria group bacterium]|nr:hypothetical protein [Patescibacteria group bacterium]
MKKVYKKNSGYAILELLFYIAIFVVLTLVLINVMLSMAKSFKETSLQTEWVQSGTIMERISREIRQAYDIGSISTSDIVLNTKDSNGNNKTVEFVLSGTDLQLLENGVLTGNLNTPNIAVGALNFTQITTTTGKAVKVLLTIKSKNDVFSRNQNFYDTIVLRGTYK